MLEDRLAPRTEQSLVHAVVGGADPELLRTDAIEHDARGIDRVAREERASLDVPPDPIIPTAEIINNQNGRTQFMLQHVTPAPRPVVIGSDR